MTTLNSFKNFNVNRSIHACFNVYAMTLYEMQFTLLKKFMFLKVLVSLYYYLIYLTPT